MRYFYRVMRRHKLCMQAAVVFLAAPPSASWNFHGATPEYHQSQPQLFMRVVSFSDADKSAACVCNHLMSHARSLNSRVEDFK